MKTVLQVPLNVDLRKEAEKQALAQGFSSPSRDSESVFEKISSGRNGNYL